MVIDDEKVQAFRRKRLEAALAAHGGDKAAFGRALGYKGGAFVRQMIDGERAIREKTVAKVESLPGFRAGSLDSGSLVMATMDGIKDREEQARKRLDRAKKDI